MSKIDALKAAWAEADRFISECHGPTGDMADTIAAFSHLRELMALVQGAIVEAEHTDAYATKLEAALDRIEAQRPAITALHMLEGKRRGLRMAADECAAQSAALLEELKEARNPIADELDSMRCHLQRLADSGELR